MNKRYRLGEIEEAVSEMGELIDIEDDIAEIDDDFKIVVSDRPSCNHSYGRDCPCGFKGTSRNRAKNRIPCC